MIGRFGRFVRSREWPPTSGVAVRSVFGLLFGVFGIVLGVVRLDPNYFWCRSSHSFPPSPSGRSSMEVPRSDARRWGGDVRRLGKKS